MGDKGLKLGLGAVILCGGLITSFNTEKEVLADVVKQTPLSSLYKDGRYDSKTERVSMGYRAGQTTYDGNKIEKVEMKTSDVFITTLDSESATSKYKKSMNKYYTNNIVYYSKNREYFRSPVRTNYYVKTKFNNNQLINRGVLNTEFIKLLNQERARVGVKPLKYASILQQGTDTRAQELSNYGHINVNGKKHVRLNYAPFWTAFTDKIPTARYELGENLVLVPYYGNPYEMVSEKRMAEVLFKQWKSSPLHYQNMINPSYKTTAVSVKLSGAECKNSPYYDGFVGANIFRNK